MAISNTPITRMANADEVTLTATGTILSIKGDGVTVTQIADDAVETVKIKDANVTPAKMSFNTAQRIAYTALSSPAADITFSGLDLETDHVYILVGTVCNSGSTGGTQTVTLYTNGETTATFYYTQVLTATASTVSTSRANNSNLFTQAEDRESDMQLTFTKIAGKEVRVTGNIGIGTGETIQHISCSNTNSTNITSITIHGSRNFTVGTALALYKMV